LLDRIESARFLQRLAIGRAVICKGPDRCFIVVFGLSEELLDLLRRIVMMEMMKVMKAVNDMENENRVMTYIVMAVIP